MKFMTNHFQALNPYKSCFTTQIQNMQIAYLFISNGSSFMYNEK